MEGFHSRTGHAQTDQGWVPNYGADCLDTISPSGTMNYVYSVEFGTNLTNMLTYTNTY